MRKITTTVFAIFGTLLLLTTPPASASSSGPWDVTTAKFSESVDISDQGGSPLGIYISPDGGQLFVIKGAVDTVFRYDLSTPYDVSSASLSQSLDIGSQEGSPEDIAFNETGEKMYILGSSGDGNVSQYELSSGFDLSTATFDRAFAVASIGPGSPTGLDISADGSKMYIVEDIGDDIYEYSLSEPHNVSSATLVQSVDLPGMNQPSSVRLKTGGDRFFVTSEDTAEVFQYDLSTDFDVSTITQTSDTRSASTFIDISAQEPTPAALGFNTSGTAMYVGGFSNDNVSQYDLTSQAPTLDNSSASPTDGVSDSSITLSIPLNDTDFTDIEGDSVEVDFFLDGENAGTDTLTSNGTAELATSVTQGGSHTWNATANDSHSLTANSQEFTFEIPSNLTIREETSPHNAITTCGNPVTFYEATTDDPTITQVSPDANGNVSLQGLPAGAEFVATIECNGYYNRSVFIESIFDQDSAFVLSQDEPAFLVEFQIQDETGEYGDGTDLIIQRAINRSEYGGSPSGFSWTAVAGDQIGSTDQLSVDLREDARYRLRVQNDDGDTRILGAHTVVGSQVVTITIEDVSITIENQSADVKIGFEKDNENNQVEFLYNDTTDGTTDLQVSIYERNNKSNELLNQTFAGPHGELFIEESVPADEMNKSWVVEFSGMKGGTTIDGVYITGDRANPGVPVPTWVKEFSSVFAILLIPTLFGGERAETGAIVAVFVAAALWWIQWTPAEITILSIILAGTLAVGFKMRERGRGNIT